MPSLASSDIPERSLHQRMEALQNANEIRSYRANLKRDIKAGRVSVHDILRYPPQKVETMKIFDLMMAVPKLGRTKIDRMFRTCRISTSKTVGGMSERQRNELLILLRR